MKNHPQPSWFAAASIVVMLVGASAGACSADSQPTLEAETDVIASTRGPIALGDGPVEVALASAESDTRLPAALESGRRLHLVLHDLAAAEPPGVLYHLYLGPRTASTEERRHLGSINFFDAVPEKAGFRSFDASAIARELLDRGLAEELTTLTIVPAGAPAPGAKAAIARAELVLERPGARSEK